MNHTSRDYSLPGSANDQKMKLRKEIEEMQKYLEDFDNSYNSTKTAVMESFQKFEILLSKMSKLVAIADGLCSDGIVETEGPGEKSSENPTKKIKLSSPNPGITTENEQAFYSWQAGPSTQRDRTEIQRPHPNENVENKTKNSVNKKESPEILIIKEPEITLIKKPEISKIKNQPVDTWKSSLSHDQISPFLAMRGMCAVSQRTGAVNQRTSAENQRTSAASQKTVSISQIGDLQIYPSEQQDEAKNVYDSDNEAVIIALDKTKGVLSREDLNSYLYISVQVEDPVQLAKISFTKDIKQLYFQLLAFGFNLKTENDRLQKEQGQIDRKLEERLKTVITTFQNEQDEAT